MPSGLNRADLSLLFNSMDDLGDTFARNRLMKQRENEFNLTRADRTRESDLDRAMREKEFGLRRDDAADTRDVRREGLANQKAHYEAIQAHQKQLLAAKTDEDKWKVLVDMAEKGMLTDDGIDRMSEEMSKKFGQLGVSVKLFKLPATKNTPQEYRHPRTGKEFVTYGNTMMPADAPYAEVSEEVDPMTGDTKRRTTRKVPAGALDAEMNRLNQRATDDANAIGEATPQQEREMQDILAGPALPAQGPPPGRVAQPPDPTRVERVAVVSPSGKRGTIPKSQLQDALKQGFKLVQ